MLKSIIAVRMRFAVVLLVILVLELLSNPRTLHCNSFTVTVFGDVVIRFISSLLCLLCLLLCQNVPKCSVCLLVI